MVYFNTCTTKYFVPAIAAGISSLLAAGRKAPDVPIENTLACSIGFSAAAIRPVVWWTSTNDAYNRLTCRWPQLNNHRRRHSERLPIAGWLPSGDVKRPLCDYYSQANRRRGACARACVAARCYESHGSLMHIDCQLDRRLPTEAVGNVKFMQAWQRTVREWCLTNIEWKQSRGHRSRAIQLTNR